MPPLINPDPTSSARATDAVHELYLNIHGFAVRISAQAPTVRDGLRRDFAYFSGAGRPPEYALHLRLFSLPPKRRKSWPGLPALTTRDYVAFDQDGIRRVRYWDSAEAEFHPRLRELHITCADLPRLHELAYLALLSKAGEALDCRGLHRIHALGFEWKGAGALLLLPSGGGKSVLALELARATEAGIFSDDTPLLTQDGRVLAFPLRWGFQHSYPLEGIPGGFVRPFLRRRHGPKHLVDIDYFRGSIRAEAPVKWLFLGRRGTQPGIEPIGRPAALWPLAVNLVAGHGVAQMAEYMIGWSAGDLARLASIACSRLALAATLLRQAGLCRFTLGPRADKNARALTGFLRDRQ